MANCAALDHQHMLECIEMANRVTLKHQEVQASKCKDHLTTQLTDHGPPLLLLMSREYEQKLADSLQRAEAKFAVSLVAATVDCPSVEDTASFFKFDVDKEDDC